MSAPAAPPPPDQATLAYQTATGRTRAQVLAYATALWAALGTYRDLDMDHFIAAVVPQVLAGQLTVANLTSVYLAQVAARRGTPTLPMPVDAKTVQDGRGVPPAQVYRRPAIEVYNALSKGVPLDKAVARGQIRLESLVSTDLQMSKVRQADASLQSAGKTKFYRRVLRGTHNCALCIISSTRRYRVGTLMPIHPGCDCDVEQIDDKHPPLVLDVGLLRDTHQMVGQFSGMANASAEGYQNLIVTREHGEIGPVMSWRDQKFTGPADIPGIH